MGAVWMCARNDLRRRWASGVVLTLLVGFASAVVLTGVAGARRTSSSYARFVAESRASDVYLFPGRPTAARLRAFSRAPFVAALAPAFTFQVQFEDGGFPQAGGPLDGRFGHVAERPRIVAGRAANPKTANEIVVAEPLARARGLQVIPDRAPPRARVKASAHLG